MLLQSRPVRLVALFIIAPTVLLQVFIPGTATGDAALGVAAAALLALGWAGIRRHRGAPRRAWTVLMLGLTALFVGNIAYLVAPATPETRGLTLPDVFWLMEMPLMTIAIVMMVRLRAPGDLRDGLLDCTVMVAAALVAVWQFLAVPEAGGGVEGLQLILRSVYPLSAVMLFGAGLLLIMAPGRRGVPTQLLLAGLCGRLIWDFFWNLAPRFYPGLPIERFYLITIVANVLVICAVLHPDNAELTTPAPRQRARLHPARMVLLGLALLTTPTVAVLAPKSSTVGRLILLVATMVIVGAILVRFGYAVREQERAQQQLQRQASIDQLTGLANRQELTVRLEGALAAAHAGASPPGVLYLDLDGFKPINDAYGHAAGDAVLVEVGRRLTQSVRTTDTVARLGGDEFVVLCPGGSVSGVVDMTQIATRLIGAVSEPIESSDRVVQVGVSVGVALFGEGTRTADALLDAADAAMYDAKRLGRSTQAGQLAAAARVSNGVEV